MSIEFASSNSTFESNTFTIYLQNKISSKRGKTMVNLPYNFSFLNQYHKIEIRFSHLVSRDKGIYSDYFPPFSFYLREKDSYSTQIFWVSKPFKTFLIVVTMII